MFPSFDAETKNGGENFRKSKPFVKTYSLYLDPKFGRSEGPMRLY